MNKEYGYGLSAYKYIMECNELMIPQLPRTQDEHCIDLYIITVSGRGCFNIDSHGFHDTVDRNSQNVRSQCTQFRLVHVVSKPRPQQCFRLPVVVYVYNCSVLWRTLGD